MKDTTTLTTTTLTTATIQMAGCTLQVNGTRADLGDLASVLLGNAVRALHQETVEAVTFEDAERYGLITLIGAARDLIEELAK